MLEDLEDDARSAIALQVKYRCATVDEFVQQFGRNVSSRGIFVRTKEPLALGTLLRLHFVLQDDSPVIEGLGSVVWRRTETENDKANPLGMGIRFLRLAAASQSMVDRIVVERSGVESRFEFLDGADLAEGVAGNGSVPPPVGPGRPRCAGKAALTLQAVPPIESTTSSPPCVLVGDRQRRNSTVPRPGGRASGGARRLSSAPPPPAVDASLFGQVLADGSQASGSSAAELKASSNSSASPVGAGSLGNHDGDVGSETRARLFAANGSSSSAKVTDANGSQGPAVPRRRTSSLPPGVTSARGPLQAVATPLSAKDLVHAARQRAATMPGLFRDGAEAEALHPPIASFFTPTGEAAPARRSSAPPPIPRPREGSSTPPPVPSPLPSVTPSVPHDLAAGGSGARADTVNGTGVRQTPRAPHPAGVLESAGSAEAEQAHYAWPDTLGGSPSADDHVWSSSSTAPASSHPSSAPQFPGRPIGEASFAPPPPPNGPPFGPGPGPGPGAWDEVDDGFLPDAFAPPRMEDSGLYGSVPPEVGGSPWADEAATEGGTDSDERSAIAARIADGAERVGASVPPLPPEADSAESDWSPGAPPAGPPFGPPAGPPFGPPILTTQPAAAAARAPNRGADAVASAVASYAPAPSLNARGRESSREGDEGPARERGMFYVLLWLTVLAVPAIAFLFVRDGGSEPEPVPKTTSTLPVPVAGETVAEHAVAPASAPELPALPPVAEPGPPSPSAVPTESETPGGVARAVIETVPPEGEVFLGDESLGTAPVTIELELGHEVTVRARKHGYEEATRALIPKSAGQASVSLELEALPHVLHIETDPRRAEIEYAGEHWTAPGSFRVAVPAEPQTLRVRKRGFQEKVRRIRPEQFERRGDRMVAPITVHLLPEGVNESSEQRARMLEPTATASRRPVKASETLRIKSGSPGSFAAGAARARGVPAPPTPPPEVGHPEAARH